MQRNTQISETETITEKELFKLLGKGKEDNSVWDDTVPIKKNKKEYSVYLTDEILSPIEYNKLCYILDNASKENTIKLYINTPGGIIDSAMMIISSLKTTKAKTVAYLSGTVASAGTIIALMCDDIIVSDFTQFMIHNYSGGTRGKGHEVKAYIKFSDHELNLAFKIIYKDFLSKKEISEVIEGKDMWLNKDEVLNRFKNMKKQEKV